jgi:hypothetical protein
MGQLLHGCATTTEAVRRALQHSQESLMVLAKGAALKDPSGLFNSSLDGNTRRAIDFHQGQKIDKDALKALIRAAVTLNISKAQSSS